jgi:hypothetical protein
MEQWQLASRPAKAVAIAYLHASFKIKSNYLSVLKHPAHIRKVAKCKVGVFRIEAIGLPVTYQYAVPARLARGC